MKKIDKIHLIPSCIQKYNGVISIESIELIYNDSSTESIDMCFDYNEEDDSLHKKAFELSQKFRIGISQISVKWE